MAESTRISFNPTDFDSACLHCRVMAMIAEQATDDGRRNDGGTPVLEVCGVFLKLVEVITEIAAALPPKERKAAMRMVHGALDQMLDRHVRGATGLFEINIPSEQ